MKTNCWLVVATMIATAAVAQVNTNTLPAIPAPATTTVAPVVAEATNAPAPVKKAAPKKKAVKKINEPSVTLVPGAATVVPPNLNLRGQAGLKGEVVGHLQKGDTVSVLSQINLDKHTPDEPAQWAKILLPAGTKVWINSRFVDKANKTVSAKKLNLRGGPGENFSVLGTLEQGASVAEITAQGDWMQIEAPGTAVAYVAAMFLEQVPAPVVATTPAPVVAAPVVVAPPVATTVTEAPPVVVTAPEPTVTPPVEPSAPAAVMVPEPVIDTNPPPPRVATHEGIVRSSVSVVAPTAYELYDPVSGNAINYLFAPTTNLDLSRYNGAQIIVTGEEGLHNRWNNIPVLTVQRIFVVNASPLEPYKRLATPRAKDQTIRGSKPQQRR